MQKSVFPSAITLPPRTWWSPVSSHPGTGSRIRTCRPRGSSGSPRGQGLRCSTGKGPDLHRQHDAQTLRDALDTGAEAVVLKPGGLGALVDALRAVARGERHVDPAIAEILQTTGDAPRLLTKREREVFALLAQGQSGEEIASELSLWAETVRTHVRNAMAKLQARTRTEAVVRALATGEIER